MDIKDDDYKVIFTENAEIELDNIYDYISKTLLSEDSAKGLMDKIEKSALRLEIFPELCSIAEGYIINGIQYRKLIVDNYILLYNVDEKNKKVNIIHAFYGRKNYLKDIGEN